MKKLMALLLIIGVLFAMTGCDNAQDAGELPPEGTADNPAPEGSDGSAASGSDNIQNTSDAELLTATNTLTRSVLQFGTGTDKGFYDLIFWPDEVNDEESAWIHSCNIVYTDYAAQTRTFLCSIPGCLHNNESCTSYVRFPSGVVLFTDAMHNKLFCMAYGSAEPNTASDEELGRLFQMDFDGSDRKEVLRLEEGESFSVEDQIVVSDNQIFFMVRTISDNNSEPKKELRVFSIDSGSSETLCEFSYTNMIASAFDRTIVINDFGEAEAVYNAFDVDTKEIKELYRGKGSLFPYKNYLFFVDISNDSADLRRLDLITGNENIVRNIPLETGSSVELYDYFDEYIHWVYIDPPKGAYEPQQKHQYLVDPDSGAVAEFSLFFDHPASGHIPVLLIADAGDSFLVGMDTENAILTLNDVNGIPHKYDIPDKLIYALISKDDYYGGAANYNIISDSVFD